MTRATVCANPANWYATQATTSNAAVRIARVIALVAMLSLIFVPEYSQGDGGSAAKSFVYHVVAGGFRVLDLAVLFSAAAFAFALGCSRRRVLGFPRKLALLLAAFGFAIGLSLLYGMRHGGQNFFFDWRALALGVAFYISYSFWIQTADDVRAAITILGLLMAVCVTTLFFLFARGHGETLLGLRIPLFDGPSISAFVFASLLGLSLSGRESSARQRWFWLLLSALAILLVALCFRRTYWGELAVGIVLLAMSARGRRMRIVVLTVIAAAIAFLFLGGSLAERVSSIDFTQEDTPYAEDNSDHVGDVLDAWAEVRSSPVMGLGLGRSYETWHIRNWKEESVMVHNAPLHVWLKYGLLGLAVYLAYHCCLFHCLRGQGRQSPPFQRAVINAALAYLAAQFLVSLAFTPWPYSAVQSTNLVAFLLAVAFVREPVCHSQPFQSSRRPSTAPPTWKTQFSA